MSICWCRLRLAAALVYCLCGWEAVDVLPLGGWHLWQHERELLMDVQKLPLVREMQTMMLVCRLFAGRFEHLDLHLMTVRRHTEAAVTTETHLHAIKLKMGHLCLIF